MGALSKKKKRILCAAAVAAGAVLLLQWQRDSQRRLMFLLVRRIAAARRRRMLCALILWTLQRSASSTRPAALHRAQMPTPRSWALGRVSREPTDPTFEQLFRLDVSTFEKLLADGRFAYFWKLQPCISRLASNEHAFVSSADQWPKDSLGRSVVPHNNSRLVTPDYVLKVVLLYLSSSGELHEHAALSGVLPSTLSELRRAGLFVLTRCLRAWLPGRIVMPTTEAECNALALRAKVFSQAFEKCIGFIDGHLLRLERSTNATVQTLNYSGYKKNDFKKAVWVMLSDGTIGWAAWDYPGSFHDAGVAKRAGLDAELALLPAGYWIAADAGFPHGDRIKKQLPASVMRCLSPEQRQLALHLNAHFKRTASENGIAQLVNPFRRLQVACLAIDDSSGRRCLVECCARLCNVRARVMQVGQIATITNRAMRRPPLAVE